MFWAVRAVTTVHPYTPKLAKVFRSACIPAPPPESLPAMDNTTFNRRSVIKWEHYSIYRPVKWLASRVFMRKADRRLFPFIR